MKLFFAHTREIAIVCIVSGKMMGNNCHFNVMLLPLLLFWFVYNAPRTSLQFPSIFLSAFCTRSFNDFKK